MNNFVIYSYPVFIGFSIGIAYIITEFYYKKYKLSLKKFNLIFFLGTFAAWIGAKALFVISAPSDQLKILFNSNFWLGGGFVFYGGLIAIILFLLFFNIFSKLTTSEVVLLLPGFTFAHALGRIGCFLAGCCFGTESNVPWATYMHLHSRHPVQLYESGLLFILAIFLCKLANKKSFKILIITYIGSYSIIRFVLEYFRGDKIRGIYQFVGDINFSTSQIISLLLIIFTVSLHFYLKRNKKYLLSNN